MKKVFVKHGAALLVMALVLGLLSACPNMLNKPDPGSSGEGLVRISLVTAGERAVSPSARTAQPRAADLYYTLVFVKGATTETKTLDQAASINVSLAEGTWSLTVTGYSDSDRTLAVAAGSATVTITAGGSSSVTVALTGSATTANGRIAYAIQFPASAANLGSLILNNYYDGSHFRTIDLRNDADGNTYSVDSGVATATGTLTVPAGYYQVLAQLVNTTGHKHAGYTDLAHVYDNAETPFAKEFTIDDFSAYTPVSALSLGAPVAPVAGSPPNTTAINETQYTGTIAWKESDGTTPVSGNFAVDRVYKAVVTLTANAAYSFVALPANAFTYTGSPTAAVTNPAGTGATIAVTITFPVPGLRYVKESPVGEGTGFSWDNASSDLQKMMDQARADKVADSGITAIVRVAEGTYKPLYAPATDGSSTTDFTTYASLTDRDKTFILRSGVEIWGGYPALATNATTDADRNWTANPTILSGDLNGDDSGTSNKTDNAYHVVLGLVAVTSKLDGLEIRGGHSVGVSGDLVLHLIGTDYTIPKSKGAGICNFRCSPVLVNMTIAGNSAPSGGGVHNKGPSTSPVLTNVIIAENSATVFGGGIHNEYASPVLTNVIISGNSASQGGGIHNENASPVLTNVIISGNSADTNGGGMDNNSACTPYLTNVVIAGNKTQGTYVIYQGTPIIRNSIIWGNSGGISSTSTVYYSIVQGDWTGAGSYNLASAPEFVSPELVANAPTTGGDYRLKSTSPAINAGHNDYYDTGGTPDLSAITTDLDGNGRIQKGTIDMGAYESSYYPAAKSFYVKEAADGSGNGSSWDNASNDLQAMIDAADAAGGGVVRVAAGTYKPKYKPNTGGGSSTPPVGEERDRTFILRPGVEIWGGYPSTATNATTEADRDWTQNETVLSGDLNDDDSGTNNKSDNAYHVVFGVDIPNYSKTILDGFTIRGGNANGSGSMNVNMGPGVRGIPRTGGGGVFNYSSSPVLTNVTITGNVADANGGGIHNAGSSAPVLTNVTITGNTAATNGGGIYNITSSPVLTNVTINGNSAGSGGGIYNYSTSSPALTNVTILGNSATRGGGIYTSSSAPVLVNVLIAGNSATGTSANGGGMYNTGSSALTLTNVSIAGNYAAATGGGIYNETISASPKIRNSIVWGNSTGISEGEPSLEVYHSIVQGGWTGTGSDNLAIDPVFVSLSASSGVPTTGGDYRLESTSPAINMGNNDYYPDTWAKWGTQTGSSAITEAVYTAYVLPALEKDAGGAGRFRDAYTADSSIDIDMGACEEQGGVTQGQRYVKQGGTGGGSSWEDASADLQAMVDQAEKAKRSGAPQAIVRVAAGTHKPLYKPNANGESITPPAGQERDRTFILRPGVEIRGGYSAGATNATTDANQDWTANLTILSGDLDNDNTGSTGDAYHVVLAMSVDGTTRLDGLEIRGGYNVDATGFLTINSHTILKYCGAGIYNSASSPVLVNVTIAGNSAESGGGIYAGGSSSSPVLTNVTISENEATTNGGGIFNSASSPILTNVVITGNTAASGGGIHNGASAAPVLTNVTIAGNYAPANMGGGIYNSSSTPKIRNSIIWGNSSGIDTAGDAPEVYYSIVQNEASYPSSNPVPATNYNLNVSPEFVSPQPATNVPTAEGNYRLKKGSGGAEGTTRSPAINAGNNAYYNRGGTPNLSAITTDLDGTARKKGGVVDMGAYEKD